MQYVIKLVKHFHSDPLYSNSLYLILSTAIMSLFGFFFWIIAARIYSQESIGLAGSLLSISALLGTIATLGLPTTIIRFLSESKYPNKIISTSLVLTFFVSIVISIFFFFLSSIFLKEIHSLIVRPSLLTIYTLTIIVSVWQQIGDAIFIAYKRTQWLLIQSILYSIIKFLFVFFFVSMMSLGIYLSNFIGMGLAITISYIVQSIIYQVNIFEGFDKQVLKEISTYSLGSYFSGLIGILPAQILPAIITSTLDAKSAAHFFLALMMINLLLIIPQASGLSLFSSASATPSLLRSLTLKSIRIQIILIILGIAGIFLFGSFILSFFGPAYRVETNTILRILSLAVVPAMINYPLATRLKVRKKMFNLNIITTLGTIAVLTASIFGIRFGIYGVTWGYVIGQFITSIIFLLEWKIKKLKN